MKLKYLLAASAASISAAIILPAPVAAQQITTGIQGTVTDEAGNPITGATVAITDTRTGATRTITTGETGNFVTTGLTTGGPYTVQASAEGFEGQTISDINTSLQGNTELSFSLASGGGVITVSAARVQLTQLAVGPGSSFSGELLTAAPTFNRDVRDIIRFDPRVSLDRDDGGSGQDRISCLGGNDRGNAFTVDGITQGDIYGLNDTGFSSRSSTPIPFDAVRETSVQFAPFDVEYGNFTGCAINVVTRSGSNTFTGGGFFEYSDSGMRGDEVDGLTVAPIEPDKRWGVNLGGPIIPDRLFFFVAYEHQEAGESQDEGPAGAGYPTELASVTLADFNEVSNILSSVYGIETGPLVTNRPFENDRYFARLDWQVNDDHRLELTYQRLEEASTRPDDFSTTASNGRITGLNTFSLSGTNSDYYSGRLYSQWSDVFSTELRYSRSEVVDVQDPVGGGEAQDENIPRIIVGTSNGGANGQILAGPGFSRTANDLRTNVDLARFTGNLDLDTHQIKFGFEYNKADLFNLFVQGATGTLYFSSIENLREGILSNGTVSNPNATQIVNGTAVGAEGNFSATGDVNDAAAEFQRTIYSAFVQDEFDISEGLSAVVGVRADWYKGDAPGENPTFVNRYAFSNSYGFSNLSPLFMPRFALTYDFADDFSVFSRSQLRGGVGIFSGGDPLVWFGNAFQNNGFGFATGTTSDAACGTGPIDVVQNGQFTGLPACFQASASSQAARGLGDTQSINAAIEQPSVVRANVGFSSGLDFTDSGLFSAWAFNVDYIYSHYRNPLTVVDLSQTPDIRKGLNGYTIDGRPIYAAIDPTVAGCGATLTGLNPAPVWTGVTAACFNTGRDDELQLINSDGYDSHVASVILSRQFDRGVFTEGGDVFFSVGYAYTDAQDRRSMYNSTAGSNYDYVAAFDRQDPDAARSFYSSTHNISTQLNFREEFFDDLSTRLSVSFIARSGRPYSLTFTGGGIFNDSASGFENALAYIPTGSTDPNIAPIDLSSAAGRALAVQVDELADFARNLDCAKDYVGQSIERNTCSNDWYFDLDLGFSQEIPGPGRLFGVNDRIRLYATFDNFLNLLDSSWNVQRRRNFAGLQDVAQVSGVDNQGRYIFSGTNLGAYESDNQVNVSSSVWRVKVGASYQF